MPYPLTAILSDLHGNVPALETALKDARRRGAQRYVCLGDVVGYGPEPRACLALVMALCVDRPAGMEALHDDPELPGVGEELSGGLCLQGNHEHALLFDAQDFNPNARRAIDWTREEVGRDEDRERSYAYWDFIQSLSPRLTDEVALFVHGSPRDPVREYLLPRDAQDPQKMAANFARMDRRVCFVGHSHVPAIYFEDQRFFMPRGSEGPYSLELDRSRAIVNVGSVGQPRDGDPRLSYVLFDGESLTFVRLEYDVPTVQERIRAVPDLPDYLADRLAVGR